MSPSTLATGLDQAVALVDSISADQLDLPTPCSQWNVRDLANHLTNSAAQMAVMAQGGKPDWSSLATHHDNPGSVLRQAADDIVAAFDAGTEAPEGMVVSELAVHTWDLATALGRDTNELEPAVAEAGYAFMTKSLTDDNRGDAFAPEQAAPEGANTYERIAAFAGRSVQD
ncbi:maleylpyruvate isomerase family mycothiol-dependent enzyme [Aeromicrobium sp.]|uniref:maleylpyruvate isomerase family mycothiol-dependent enzyme n=1 Tax=Aeromicrobium sp. TaxID=1871063 RepID=UPI002FC78C0A